MEERHRRADQPDVVVVGRAPEEGDDAGRLVAQPEPEHVDEEAFAGLDVGCAPQHVTEPPGRRRAVGEYGRRPIAVAHRGTGTVHRRCVVRRLHYPTAHRGADADADHGLDDRDAAVLIVGGVVVRDLETAGCCGTGDAGEIVGVVSRQRHLDQLANGSLDDMQLFTTVAGREPARRRFGQPELAVELPGLVDPWHAERHRPESVKRHGAPLADAEEINSLSRQNRHVNGISILRCCCETF